MVSGLGALPLLRNLTNLVRVGASNRPQARAHFPHQTGNHLGPQGDKNTDNYPL